MKINNFLSDHGLARYDEVEQDYTIAVNYSNNPTFEQIDKTFGAQVGIELISLHLVNCFKKLGTDFGGQSRQTISEQLARSLFYHYKQLHIDEFILFCHHYACGVLGTVTKGYNQSAIFSAINIFRDATLETIRKDFFAKRKQVQEKERERQIRNAQNGCTTDWFEAVKCHLLLYHNIPETNLGTCKPYELLTENQQKWYNYLYDENGEIRDRTDFYKNTNNQNYI